MFTNPNVIKDDTSNTSKHSMPFTKRDLLQHAFDQGCSLAKKEEFKSTCFTWLSMEFPELSNDEKDKFVRAFTRKIEKNWLECGRHKARLFTTKKWQDYLNKTIVFGEEIARPSESQSTKDQMSDDETLDRARAILASKSESAAKVLDYLRKNPVDGGNTLCELLNFYTN